MADYGISVPTAQVTTGNVATVNDKYDTTKPLNGAVNPLGRRYDGVVTSVSNPSGYPVAYRYVQYNPTAAVTLNASGASQNVPGVVYWKDETFTDVTPTYSEGLGGSIAAANVAPFVAGLLLNPSATATYFVFIQVAGLLPKCVVPASTTIGDELIGTATGAALQWTRAAAGTAIANKVSAWGASASSGSPNLGDIYITIETL